MNLLKTYLGGIAQRAAKPIRRRVVSQQDRMRKRFGIAVLTLVIVAVSVIAYLPVLSDHGRIVWSVAIQVLYSGQVTHTFQSHHLDVTLQLKNGTVLTTKEPTIDAIFQEVTSCGEPCRSIEMATE